MLPLTLLGEAAAAVATVGAAFVTVTLADPLTLPLLAVTVAEPDGYGAVYKPEPVTRPTPLLPQVKVGWLTMATLL